MRLRSLLLRWLLVPTLALWGLGFAAGYSRSLAQANEAYDRTLLGSALVIGERLEVVDGEVVADLPYAALEMLRTDAQDRVFYRVAELDSGRTITGYAELPPPAAVPGVLPAASSAMQAAADPEPEPLFYDTRFRDEAVRAVALQRVLVSDTGPRRLLVQVAETQAARHQLTRRMVAESAAVQLLLIAAAAALIAYGVQRGLAPLKRLRDEVRRRDVHDLTPIDPGFVPREVAPLIDAINSHTARQRQLAEAQARFVANASHQLKTPLTVLRAQVDHALMQDELPAMRALVAGLHETTDATSRLVGQLLSLARSEPGLRFEVQDIDLNELAHEVSFEQLPAARAKGIDLGFEGSTPVPVRGERVLLHELVANLVHNAIVYTPALGRVTVDVSLRGTQPALQVIDNGPGIAADERARVFERFYRLPSADTQAHTQGSGLGLAIVKEICDRHGITVTLADAPGGGLCVSLLWPA